MKVNVPLCILFIDILGGGCPHPLPKILCFYFENKTKIRNWRVTRWIDKLKTRHRQKRDRKGCIFKSFSYFKATRMVTSIKSEAFSNLENLYSANIKIDKRVCENKELTKKGIWFFFHTLKRKNY